MLAVCGRGFCKTLVDYVNNQERVNRIVADLKIRFPTGGTTKSQVNGYKADDDDD